MRTFILYHLPVILYGAVILAVSSIPYLQTPEVRFLAFDKVAHFMEYALFAYLAFRSAARLVSPKRIIRAFLITFAILAIFAVIDEGLQSFTPGRHPDVLDYAFDVVGGTLVLLLMWLKHRRANRIDPDTASSPAQ